MQCSSLHLHWSHAPCEESDQHLTGVLIQYWPVQSATSQGATQCRTRTPHHLLLLRTHRSSPPIDTMTWFYSRISFVHPFPLRYAPMMQPFCVRVMSGSDAALSGRPRLLWVQRKPDEDFAYQTPAASISPALQRVQSRLWWKGWWGQGGGGGAPTGYKVASSRTESSEDAEADIYKRFSRRRCDAEDAEDAAAACGGRSAAAAPPGSGCNFAK